MFVYAGNEVLAKTRLLSGTIGQKSRRRRFLGLQALFISPQVMPMANVVLPDDGQQPQAGGAGGGRHRPHGKKPGDCNARGADAAAD